MSLHPKIEEFRRSLDSSPIRRSNPIPQPSTISLTKRDPSDYEKRVLRQYFCVWGIKDDYGTKPVRGCFSKSIKERGPKSNSTYKIIALYMHNQGNSVGLPTILEEDEIGLFAEVPIMDGIQVCDELVIRHQRKACNNGSYGFNYVWDKMEYDDTDESIVMKESDLYEISFVTIGSQKGTYGIRNSDGIYTDEYLLDDTEDLIKRLPRKDHLELRSLIDRHITLAKLQPLETRQQALETTKPKQGGIDYNYLIKNL